MTKKLMILLMCVSFFITGCESISSESLLPEEVIASAIDTNQEVKDYYMVSNMKIFLNGELTDEMTTKEWSSRIDGQLKRRSEITTKEDGKMISIINEKEAIMYQEDTNEVFTLTYEMEESGNLNKSLKQRTMDELDILRNQYTIENLGEEKIDGKNTYHIKGEPKKNGSLLGDYEMWIDKENWIVVRSISNTGDQEIILENEEIDFSPKIEASMFELDIPEDAKIINLDDFNSKIEDITIEEANEKLDGKLLSVNDKEYKLEKIQSLQHDSNDIPDEIIFDYSKDGESTFTISIIKRKAEEIQKDIEDREVEIREGTALIKEEIISIRQEKGFVMEGIINVITFYEDGLQYNFIIEEDKITIEEAADIIENMK